MTTINRRPLCHSLQHPGLQHPRLQHLRRAFIIICCTALLMAADAMAQSTQYIRDQLYVPLRSGQGNEYRILNSNLSSGTQLTVLEVNESSGWSRVRTRGGQEGWMESQYLTPTPVAADLLKRVQAEAEKLRTANTELREQLQGLRSEHSTSTTELNQLSKQNQQVASELAELQEISANTVKIDRDNKQLLQTNEMLRNQLEVLQTDNQRLHDSKENEAFLNGAIAVIIGVMIALVVPRLWPKRRSEWA